MTGRYKVNASGKPGIFRYRTEQFLVIRLVLSTRFLIAIYSIERKRDDKCVASTKTLHTEG